MTQRIDTENMTEAEHAYWEGKHEGAEESRAENARLRRALERLATESESKLPRCGPFVAFHVVSTYARFVLNGGDPDAERVPGHLWDEHERAMARAQKGGSE